MGRGGEWGVAPYGDFEYYQQQSYIQSAVRKNVPPYMVETDEGFAERKKAYDEFMQFLKEQQEALDEQAKTLEDLASGAESAQGRLEAIQSTNQLLQFIASQMIEMRLHLQAQATAQAILTEKAMADDAKREAATRHILRDDARIKRHVEDKKTFSFTAD